MEEEKKKHKERPEDLVYVLAEYKQLVIQYKTRQAELLKASVFWKTSALWLVGICGVTCLLLALAVCGARRLDIENRRTIHIISSGIEANVLQSETLRKELDEVRQELAKKTSQVGQLEKNLSTASKKQVERLLKDSGEK